MTRVLIVEDQSMPRTLFEMYVNQSENYTLAGSISNADMTDYHCENSDNTCNKLSNRTDKCENAADIKHSHIVCTVVKSCKCGDTENGDD